MRAFFQGWRRKSGCGLLLLACALIAPWTDSYSIEATIEVPRPFLQHVVTSRNGAVYWSAHSISKSRWKFARRALDDPRCRPDPFADDDLESRDWVIPYWSLVLPLTVISAALIGWSFRRPHRQSSTTPRLGLIDRWRRRAGYITLALAGGLLMMWIRSGIASTVIDVNNSQTFFSQSGNLYWAFDGGFEGNPSIIHHWFDDLKRRPEPGSGPRFAYLWKQRWHRGGRALGWGYDTTGTIGVHWLQIHYGILVPLLACLSAWLILRARRTPIMMATDANS